MNKHEVFIGMNITKEQQEDNYQHYLAIKDKVEILSSKKGYAHCMYQGQSNDNTLTKDEIALVCDKGNLCFGYEGMLNEDGNFLIKVYTD